MKTDLSDLKDRLDNWENYGNLPRAGFRFPTGNAGYGIAGILFGFILADKLRKKKNEKKS
jgi:hypothetical protein